MTESSVRAWLASPPGRGGVAVLDLVAEHPADLDEVLHEIASGPPVVPGGHGVRRLASIDDGLVVRIDRRHAQLMPHGGPAIVARLAGALDRAGAAWCSSPPPGRRPETGDPVESAMLDALSTARSSAAVDPLLRQPEAWRNRTGPLTDEERERGRRLGRLLTPAIVACVGPPNAGKSALLNALLRETAVLVSDRAGTTRDHVSRLLDLDGVIVEWVDLPGLRRTDDPIEAAAIAASLPVLKQATLIVHLVAPDVPDPGLPSGLEPVEGVLKVGTKCDLASAGSIGDLPDLRVSALEGVGITELAGRIRTLIVRPEDLAASGRWRFTAALPEPDDR